MSITSTSEDLRRAAAEARDVVQRIVSSEPGIALADLYQRTLEPVPRWQEPAVRTAIWDLIAERSILIRPGNRLHPHI